MNQDGNKNGMLQKDKSGSERKEKKSKQFEWYAVLIRIDSRLVFLYKK